MKQNRLSAWGYIQNNKQKVIVLMIAITLSFMAMYVVKFIFGSVVESFKPVFIENPKRICYVNMEIETMGLTLDDYDSQESYWQAYYERQDEIIASLKALDGIEDAYESQLLSAEYNAVVGMVNYVFPLIEDYDQISRYLTHMNATLEEGRIPKEEGEVLVDTVVMKNNHLQVGDYFLEKYYGKTFKIVGTLRSDAMVCVGTPNGYTNNGYAIVIYCEEDNSNAKELFKKIGITLSDNDTIIDSEKYMKSYKEDTESIIESVLTILNIVIIIFLAISIIVAYVSFLRGRVEEYCLYMSIGYSRSAVYGMIMREISIIFAISILVGAFITMITMKVLAVGVLEPMGAVYCYWYPEHLLTVIAAYVAIVGILQIPIVFAVNRIKTIDRIEE